MLTVKSYLLPTASDCKQRLSKGCQNVSLLRPILKAHFCRKQCANDNPTTQGTICVGGLSKAHHTRH